MHSTLTAARQAGAQFT